MPRLIKKSEAMVRADDRRRKRIARIEEIAKTAKKEEVPTCSDRVRRDIICYKCKGNHIPRECPYIITTCYNCGGSQHMAHECWLPVRIADTGQVSEEPDGVIFLADCIARTEYDGGAPFALSITFRGTFDKILILATRDEEALSKWITAINNASYDLLRERVSLLRQRLTFARS